MGRGEAGPGYITYIVRNGTSHKNYGEGHGGCGRSDACSEFTDVLRYG